MFLQRRCLIQWTPTRLVSITINTSASLANDRFPINSYFQTAIWCLRLTIAAQCVGISGRYLFGSFETESSIYGLLFFEYGLSEITAQFIDDFGVYGCLIAGVTILFNGVFADLPKLSQSGKSAKLILAIDFVALAFVAAWTLSMGIAQTIRGDLFAKFTLLEEAVRIATPAVLVVLLLGRKIGTGSFCRVVGTIVLLVATSTTFALHGYKAIELYAPFLDYLLLSQPFGLPLVTEQQTAERLLGVIGWLDVALAILLLVFRWQWIALYMAAWGLLTAFSRITAGGMEAWPEVFIRAANAGAPLTLFFLFRMNLRSGNTIKYRSDQFT